MFAGWVDENGDSVDLINVTEDMDVFASFHSGCPEHYEWDGSECEVSTITVGCDSTDMPTEHATASNPTVTVEWDFDK